MHSTVKYDNIKCISGKSQKNVEVIDLFDPKTSGIYATIRPFTLFVCHVDRIRLATYISGFLSNVKI